MGGSTGLSECTPCPPTKYCDDLTGVSGPKGKLKHILQHDTVIYLCPYLNFVYIDCPIGAYCPENTYSMNQFLCPPGTFSNRSLLGSLDQCSSCLAGMFCDSYGLLMPSGPCYAGYFCGGGSSSATPQYFGDTTLSYKGDMCQPEDSNILNGICPPGNYCPQGSVSPIPCPPGTNTSALGLQDVSECQPCMKGMYCPAPGTSLAIRPCVPGYYCPTGTINPITNSSLRCPIGNRCPQGSSEPIPCSQGTYQDMSGQSTCLSCPRGYICNIFSGTITPIPCGTGTMCPLGSSKAISCASGTYQDETKSGSCKSCPAGYYCSVLSGTIHPQPCPIKSYCPPGSSLPLLCPPGTFGNGSMLTSSSECSVCIAGRYCSGGVLAGMCSAGYFCRFGASTPAPFVDTTGLSLLDISVLLASEESGQCPPNYYCPIGTSNPIPCRLFF